MQDAAHPNVNQRIAARLRDLRAARGLSLEALAGRCGVSRSMLSLIERGESSATAVVLERIATGLGVPLASLFDDPPDDPRPVARAADHPAWRDPQTGYLRRNLTPSGLPAPLHLVDVELPAGARVAFDTALREPTLHQQVWVRAGELTVTLGADTWRLAADDCLAMRLDRPISFHNKGDVPARYLVAVVDPRAGR